MIAVDGNNLAYRYKKFPHINFTNDRGEKTGSVYGVLISLLSYIRKFEDKDVVVCWDSRHNIRKSEVTSYKANRNHEGDEPIFEQMNTLHDVLPFFGFSTVKVYGYEADDVAYTLGLNYEKVCFVSKDEDWTQFVDEVKGNKLFNVKDIIEQSLQFSYSIYHAIIGSRKDNVIGLTRFDHKIAFSLAETFNDIDKVINSDLGDSYGFRETKTSRILRQNYDLLTSKYVKNFDDFIRKPLIDNKSLLYFCKYFNFKNMYASVLEVFA